VSDTSNGNLCWCSVWSAPSLRDSDYIRTQTLHPRIPARIDDQTPFICIILADLCLAVPVLSLAARVQQQVVAMHSMQGSSKLVLGVVIILTATLVLQYLPYSASAGCTRPNVVTNHEQQHWASAYNFTRQAYLKLVENTVTGTVFDEFGACGGEGGCPLAAMKPYNVTQRQRGEDWPVVGHTMVGHLRLQNVRDLVLDVLARGVPGAFAELGVWRGGVCIYVKALMDTHMPKEHRQVIVFDAFEKVPGYGSAMSYLANSEATVRHNFEKYGLLDERVIFVKGLFKDTLPGFAKQYPDLKFSVLRLDSNFYDSYQDSFYYLYERLSMGGYLIMDDIR